MPLPHRAIVVVGEKRSNTTGCIPGSGDVGAARGAVASRAKAALTPALPRTLKSCHELIEHLRQENVRLRQVGAFLGQLAEQFNHELRRYRDMPAEPRPVHHRGHLGGMPIGAADPGDKANDH